MREAGRILAITHDELAKRVRPGMSTLEVDRIGNMIFCLEKNNAGMDSSGS